MAGVFGCATQGAIASGTSAKTLMQLVAASNHRTLIKGWGLSFDGATSDATPVKVELLRQSTAGTMTSLTVVKENDSDDETLQTTAQHTATAEPTAGDIIETHYVHPQGGSFDVFYPHPGQAIKGGGRMGVRVTAAATVNVSAWMRFEE